MDNQPKKTKINRHFVQTTSTITLIISLTVLVFLYTAGYRLNKETNEVAIDFKKTGMVSARSIPESANVYVNEVLKTATNDSVPALDPGTYKLRIEKSGFVPWEKEVDVFAELVTDITAVLVSQSPRLEPLTNTGARGPYISPSLSKLAYFSSDSSENTAPGISIIPLTGNSVSLFKSNPFIAIEDTFGAIVSKGKSIEWSPDEEQLLIEGPNNAYHLVTLETQNIVTLDSPEEVRAKWVEETTGKRTIFMEKLDLPEDIKAIATDPSSVWSPDEKKFLYTIQDGDTLQYKVYNMEKPRPVGEMVDTTVFVTNINEVQPFVTWYADSYHLILTEVEKPIQDNIQDNIEIDEKATITRGVINLIRIDGTNKTEIYSNVILSENVYSSPGGEKLIFLTSFKSSGQPDLYTVGIR